jgi:hypothetical protein
MNERRVIIVGGGFGAVTLAHHLGNASEIENRSHQQRESFRIHAHARRSGRAFNLSSAYVCCGPSDSAPNQVVDKRR